MNSRLRVLGGGGDHISGGEFDAFFNFVWFFWVIFWGGVILGGNSPWRWLELTLSFVRCNIDFFRTNQNSTILLIVTIFQIPEKLRILFTVLIYNV